MFVEQEQHDCDDAGKRQFAEGEHWKERGEKDQHDEMKSSRDPESGRDSDVAGDGVQFGVAVELEILAGVEDIEAGDPESNRRGEQQDAQVERTPNCDPCGGWGDAKSEAQNEMGQTREALGIGVEQQHGKCDGRKPEGKAIQLRGGQNKDGAGDDDEGANERGREISRGNSASAGTRIGGIDGRVGEPVESHCRGAGGEHRNDDPYKLMRTRKAGSGEHGSAESERESEDGVLPLDHFERNAQVAQDGHRKIVRQGDDQLAMIGGWAPARAV